MLANRNSYRQFNTELTKCQKNCRKIKKLFDKLRESSRKNDRNEGKGKDLFFEFLEANSIHLTRQRVNVKVARTKTSIYILTQVWNDPSKADSQFTKVRNLAKLPVSKICRWWHVKYSEGPALFHVIIGSKTLEQVYVNIS